MFKLSSFRLRVFRQCRRRYKYQYVERIPTRPTAYNTMGAHVHTALKTFFSLEDATQRTPDALVDLLLESWQHNRAGFTDLADEERWRQRALAQIRTFAQMHDLAARPLLLEGYFEAPVNPNLALLGRIDRVDEDRRGLHIIDYKTGRRPEEVDSEQLHIYTIILETALGRPVARASYLYLDDGSVWSVEPRRDDLDASLASALTAYEEMLAEREYFPVVGKHCALCDYQEICPQREEIVGRRLLEGW
ncbi:MAG: PD-(D/E)XK nuclease family protein [Dehalococcoidia bacterium]|nr:PD-(D/E)XK nuclease family protein [Dehalococcoidia bacterium]